MPYRPLIRTHANRSLQNNCKVGLTVWQTPHASILTSTSSSPHLGTGTSSTVMGCSGACMMRAFMVWGARESLRFKRFSRVLVGDAGTGIGTDLWDGHDWWFERTNRGLEGAGG